MRPKALTPAQLADQIASLQVEVSRLTDQLRQALGRAERAEHAAKEAWAFARAVSHLPAIRPGERP